MKKLIKIIILFFIGCVIAKYIHRLTYTGHAEGYNHYRLTLSMQLAAFAIPVLYIGYILGRYIRKVNDIIEKDFRDLEDFNQSQY